MGHQVLRIGCLAPDVLHILCCQRTDARNLGALCSGTGPTGTHCAGADRELHLAQFLSRSRQKSLLRHISDNPAKFLRYEEEGLVVLGVVHLREEHWAADGKAKIVVAQHWRNIRAPGTYLCHFAEKGICIQCIVPNELIGTCVKAASP